MPKVSRHNSNPIISPEDVTPLIKECEVIGVFNAATALYQGDIILILRVAERPIKTDENEIKVPIYDTTSNTVEFKQIVLDDTRYDFSDSRVVRSKLDTHNDQYLTSMSYLRLARSKDGIKFKIEEKAFLFPNNEIDEYGIEDPRCSLIGDTFYITYTAVSRHGASVGLASTEDFSSVVRHGIIFPPENKDVVLFPEKIGGNYYAIHRPVPHGIGSPEMWMADSKDGMHWGNHRFFLGLRTHHWDSRRIGAGAVPIKTESGWLEIYHAVDDQGRYCLGAVLLDLNDPFIVLARSNAPIVVPEADYEISGFYPNVIFTCGAIVLDETLRVYYGAADYSVACLDIPLVEVLNELRSPRGDDRLCVQV